MRQHERVEGTEVRLFDFAALPAHQPAVLLLRDHERRGRALRGLVERNPHVRGRDHLDAVVAGSLVGTAAKRSDTFEATLCWRRFMFRDDGNSLFRLVAVIVVAHF